MSSKPVVILDRDGTIIEDRHYIANPDDVVFLPEAIRGLRQMLNKGYALCIVSNQSGVGRGLISDEQFQAVHQRFCEMLQAEGVEVAEFGYCFHHPDDKCRCRKPEIGLVPTTCNNAPIDLTRSAVVGDRASDLRLGQKLGARPFLVLTGHGIQTHQELFTNDESHFTYEAFANLNAVAQALPDVSQ